MKKLIYFIPLIFALSFFTSCEIEDIENPNGPTLEALEEGASLEDIRLLATGLESLLRFDMEFYYWTTSMVGREYYDLTGTDPRYTGEILGQNGESLDNNGFLTTRAYTAAYKVIRNAQILMDASANADFPFTAEQLNAINGYAKTVQAYEFLLLLNRQFQNGIRFNVADPDNLGPFISYDAAMSNVANLLDEARTNLQNGGDEFPIFLSSGFEGYDTPTDFVKFNRAIATRVALYQDRDSDVLDIIKNSFFDINGDLDEGVYHVFGTSGNDLRNPLFTIPDVTFYMAQEDWVNSAEANDNRIGKHVKVVVDSETGDSTVIELADLSSQYQVVTYGSDTDPVPIIRNEELVLIYAEANIGVNNPEAVKAINVVRNAADLGNYAGDPNDANALLNEVVKQRRYSLFGEGHRWIDLRRLSKLGDIVIERPGSVVHTQFPTPADEL